MPRSNSKRRMANLTTTMSNSSNDSQSEDSCFCSDIVKQDYSSSYGWFNYVLIIICLAAVSLFGLITNCLNVYIYSRPRLRNSSNAYLLALACSDFFVVVTGFCIFWIDSMRTYAQSLKYAPYMSVYALPIGYIAQTCSVYFTVAAATDCYLNTCWRRSCKNLHTVRGVSRVCSAVLALSVVYNSLRFGQFKLRSCFPDSSSDSIIEICPTDFLLQINTVYNVYLYMVFMTFLPFVALSVLNILIIVRVKFRAKTASQSKDADADEGTITLIMVVVMFLSCNTLALVVNIVESFSEISELLLNYLTDASNFLIVFNSSVNFLIYLTFSAQFRIVFLQMFTGRRTLLYSDGTVALYRDQYSFGTRGALMEELPFIDNTSGVLTPEG